jgi:hypothetical protein
MFNKTLEATLNPLATITLVAFDKDPVVVQASCSPKWWVQSASA